MSITEITYPNIDPRVRVFSAGSEVDCFVVISDSHVIILDTFTTPEDALEMMQILKLNLEHRVLLVINSHQHSDHTWGNSVFAQDGAFPAPILAHKNSKNFLDQQRMQLLEQQKLESRLMSVKIVAPTVYFSDSCSINAGDLTLELIPAFGHTSDQVVVWIANLVSNRRARVSISVCGKFGEFGAIAGHHEQVTSHETSHRLALSWWAS
jgi:glyoxylase-like metal-dependent hydrolase (beta-lactamase superfamily II)